MASLQIESKNVFPLSQREFAGEWDQIWGTGFYKAVLTMSYGSAGQVVMAETSFWLIPITLLMAIVFALLALLAMIIAIRRHLIHRRQDQSAQIKELEQKVNELEKEKQNSL